LHDGDDGAPLLPLRVTQMATPQERMMSPRRGLRPHALLRLRKESDFRRRSRFGYLVVQFILREMLTNAQSQAVKDLRNRIGREDFAITSARQEEEKESLLAFCEDHLEACSTWRALVQDHGPWDHKPKIFASWGGYQIVHFSAIHLHGWVPFYYSIWSCIHFGYVGLAAGLPQQVLEDGANYAHIGLRFTPQPLSDLTAMRIGMELFRAGALRAGDMLRNTRSLLRMLYRDQDHLLHWDIERQRSYPP
jgi:hypothetical protein